MVVTLGARTQHHQGVKILTLADFLAQLPGFNQADMNLALQNLGR
jgi:hypothetical protein